MGRGCAAGAAELHGQLQQRLPVVAGPVGLLETLDDAIDLVRGLQQPGQPGAAQLRQHALEQAFALAPHALLAQGQRQRAALRHGVFHPLERADVLGQRVVHQHFGNAFGAQAVEHALHALKLPRQHRLGELEDIVAGDVQDGAFNLLETELPGRVQQRQLLDFLVRGQQVTFHPVGEKLQTALARRTGLHALLVARQALRDPLWQSAALDGIDLQRDAKALQRAEPGGVFAGTVQLRQQHQAQRRIVILRRLRQLLDGFGSGNARLAAGQAQLKQLFVGKQAQGATGCQHLGPIEVGPDDAVHAAFGKALRPGGSADGIRRFLHQQRLVAMQRVEALQPVLQVLGELIRGELHGPPPPTAAATAARCRFACCGTALPLRTLWPAPPTH